MNPYSYITLEEALNIYVKTIENSGGGLARCLESGRIESVLCHVQNDDYYPTFADKLTHLFFSICQYHCFADGNKRIAITLATHFLLKNGYLFVAKDFIPKTENISYYVAAGKISESLLHDIFVLMLNGKYDSDEEIKLAVLNAISQ